MFYNVSVMAPLQLTGKGAVFLSLLLFVNGLCAAGSGSISTEEQPVASGNSTTAGESAAQILAYFAAKLPAQTDQVCSLSDAARPFVTKQFALEGRCKNLNEKQACAYYDYRKLDLNGVAGFDQQGVNTYQVTFPGNEHLWAALSVHNPPGSVFCWMGGALIGRNPLAMTWSGDTGTKSRKNNFILSKSGTVEVNGARIHNLHDIFLASGREAGIHVDGSWITWNRDDFFEGFLRDIRVSDTLVDGTFTFISDRDGECNDEKKAADKNILIENSLIRLQRLPGPYARHTSKWHWKIEGGHNTLWKLDSCDWEHWPTFSLINNVFLIEGARTTRNSLYKTDCRLALPGSCKDPSLGNIKECRNNLFLYTDYRRWRLEQSAPGPVPQSGNRFHNANNPMYLPNGIDCYQRLTDDNLSSGFADVLAVWKALRSSWVSRHTDPGKSDVVVMQIPGVDTPVFENGSKIRVSNRKTGECLTSGNGDRVLLRPCDDSSQQLFHVETFDDGKLVASLLLKDWRDHYLRTQPPEVLEKDDGNSLYDPTVFSQVAAVGKPSFSERWYVLPLDDSSSNEDYFSIESDAIGRSFLRQNDSNAEIQALFANGNQTALPQARFFGGDDQALQWKVQVAK